MKKTTFALLFLGHAACAHEPSSGSSDRLNRETDQFVFEVVRITAECLAANPPLAPGKVIVAADMGSAGSPARVFNTGSTGGNKASLDCATRRGQQELKTPRGAPARYVQVFMLLPGGPGDVRIRFAKVLE